MLNSRTAVVTGSTSGIGLGIAEALAGQGANVVLNGFGDKGAIEEIRARLDAASQGEVIYNGADMTKPQEIEALIASAEETFGAVDILVNNAGIQHVSPVEEFPIDKWDAIIAINLSSAFHTIRAALAGMKQRKWGRIINLASAHGHVASPYKAAYVAAKHGMLGLTKTVALEVAQSGVTVNAVSPGYVLTPLVEAQIPDTARTRGITEEEVVRDVILAAQPTKSFVGVDQVASLCVYLVSDAASQITGTSLSIDGGWTAQ
ncbi:MAG: 3-hydroxybutyrate dehydrogenase [Rhizobiales bacterium]|nr:3-hydroxybutyrate dehydrogenase [Hyphomicrobiales bacterium]